MGRGVMDIPVHQGIRGGIVVDRGVDTGVLIRLEPFVMLLYYSLA